MVRRTAIDAQRHEPVGATGLPISCWFQILRVTSSASRRSRIERSFDEGLRPTAEWIIATTGAIFASKRSPWSRRPRESMKRRSAARNGISSVEMLHTRQNAALHASTSQSAVMAYAGNVIAFIVSIASGLGDMSPDTRSLPKPRCPQAMRPLRDASPGRAGGRLTAARRSAIRRFPTGGRSRRAKSRSSVSPRQACRRFAAHMRCNPLRRCKANIRCGGERPKRKFYRCSRAGNRFRAV